MTTPRTKKKNGPSRIGGDGELLVARWNEVVSRSKGIDWSRSSIATLAANAGLEWYRMRRDEPVEDFLALEGRGLFRLHGFGRGKVRRLCEIMESVLGGATNGQKKNFPTTVDPFETLAKWEIPRDFPTPLMMLSVRMAKQCASSGLHTLAHLVHEWETFGFRGFMARKSLGRVSVEELQTFMESLKNADRETAQSFLPLHPCGRGLSLGRALGMIVAGLGPTERSLLARRLVERMTLEESSEEIGLTRERVRQVEQDLLDSLQVRLTYFRDSSEELLDDWMAGRDWFARLRNETSEEDDDLLEAAIEALFGISPQAVVRAQDLELRLVDWHENLLRHSKLWFGGVRFRHFLKTNVPFDDRAALCDRLADSSELRLDHVDDKVYPARIGLSDTAAALLAAQDSPIPLSRLVRLLLRTGYHPGISGEVLLRRRRAWRRRQMLPKDRVLWNK